MKRLRIEVPATSANLGPGFDTLGLALDIVDTVEVELDPAGNEVTLCRVEGADLQLDPHQNLLCRAYRRWGEASGVRLPGARFALQSAIPVGRGFGSSAASIVAGLAAGAHASETKDAAERILQLAVEMEGHPDNVAATVLGGLTVAFCDGDRVHAITVANHLSIGIALFVPEQPLRTSEARAALPREVPLADAVFDLGRLAYLVTALIWGRWDQIGPAMQDRLHQPYRASLIPGLEEVIAAAVQHGAYGATLSGGGPAVIALGPADTVTEWAQAMEARARDCDWRGRSLITSVRATGVQVREEPVDA